jgi:hypothetical protein
MSHRTALTLSIILTFVLAAGIIAGRDRLFTAEAAPNAASVTSAPTVATGNESSVSQREASTTGPRVIDIPLPALTDGTSSQPITDETQPRGDRNTSHERERDGENEHEEGDD